MMYQNMRNYVRFEGDVGTAAHDATKPGKDLFVKFSFNVDNSYRDKDTGKWDENKSLVSWVTVKLNDNKRALDFVGTGPNCVEIGDRVIVEGQLGVRQYEWNGEVRIEVFIKASPDGVIIRNKKSDRGKTAPAAAAPLAEVPTPTNAPTNLVITGHDPNGLL